MLSLHQHRTDEAVTTYLIREQNGFYGFSGNMTLGLYDHFPTMVDLVNFCCHVSTCAPLVMREGVTKEQASVDVIISLHATA